MNEELKKEEFIKLENRIWKTYQSRIKAATRLLESNKCLDFFSAYYTISLSILSVFTLINDNKIVAYFSALTSIVVMGLVFYGNSMNYKDRYINMKNNYLKLGDLYYECLKEKIKNNYDLHAIYNKYSELLNNVENHTTNDYRKYQYNDLEEKNKMSFISKTIYITKWLFCKTIILFAFITPLIMIIYSIIIIYK